MSAPLSLRDKQFAFLVGQYGPGLSYADMLSKYLGGGKSLSDLEYAAYLGDSKLSLADNMNTVIAGSGSLSDKMYADSSGGIVTNITNLINNPYPASLSSWTYAGTAGNWVVTYASSEISADRQAAAPANIAVSMAVTGLLVANPVLKVGVNYQRSVEVWVDAPATVVTLVPNGYAAGQALPANQWTRVSQQFTGNGVASYVTAIAINIPGVGTGVHVKFRKAMLCENPTGKELAYTDGNSPGWVWDGAVNNSTSHGPPIYVSDNPVYAGPTPLHAFWAGNPDMGAIADGTAIASWLNYGGGSLTNTGGAAQPTYKKSDLTLNGKPSLVFNGTANYLSVDVTDAAQTYYAVAISSGNTWGRGVLGTGGSVAATDGVGIRSSNGNWFTCAGTVLDSLIVSSAVAPTLTVAKFAGAASEIQVNSAAAVVGAAGAEVLSYFKVGCMGLVGANASFWTGSVAFAAIYSSDPRLDSKWPAILAFARSCGVPV